MLHSTTFRDARSDDASHLAILADMATRRLTSWLWAAGATEGQSPMEVGRAVIGAGEGGTIHHSNWRVATLGDRVVGGLNGYVLGAPATSKDATILRVLRPLDELKAMVSGSWYISVLAVFAEARGRGVGADLLAEARACASAAGCDRLTLVVGSFNTTAHSLYLRSGFEERGRRPFVPFAGSDPQGDWILMSLDVAGAR